MLTRKTVLFLDLDGVLITTPQWKQDELDADGYSKFDSKCVNHLNTLLGQQTFEIVLSSTGRRTKNIAVFNRIFSFRGIAKFIDRFLPEYDPIKSRSDELSKFIGDASFEEFIILDDDKSLNGASVEIRNKWVGTEQHRGFDSDKLQEAFRILGLINTGK